jgi:hypothetical protein
MRVITLDSNSVITATKTVGDTYTLQTSEIESSIGNIGDIRQTDGTFVRYVAKSSTSTSSTADYVTTTTTTTVYQWQKWDTTTNAYADDTTNTDTILGVTPTSGAATVVTTSTTTDTMGKLQSNLLTLQTVVSLMDAAIAATEA